jgi:hypothetical protein
MSKLDHALDQRSCWLVKDGIVAARGQCRTCGVQKLGASCGDVVFVDEAAE